MAGAPITGRTAGFLVSGIFVAAMLSLSVISEPPLGSLKGRVIAADTGRPLPRARISLVALGDKERKEKLIRSGGDGSFEVTTLAAGDYKIRVDTPAHELPSTLVTIEEGKSTVFDAEVSPKPSFMDLVVHQHVYTPGERPTIAFKGFVQADAVQLTVYRADMDSLLKDYGGNLAQMLNPRYTNMWGSSRRYDLESNKALTLVRTVSEPVTKRDIEGIFYRRASLDGLSPGMYVMKAQADRIERFDWLMVTDLALITKQSGNTLLAYTTDIMSGKPAGGAVVEAYEGRKLIGSARTDTSGLVLQTLTPRNPHESVRLIVAKRGDSAAFTSSYIYQQEGRKARMIYAYTDRPIYRPGQEVFYKGIVRRFEKDRYVTPDPEPVQIQIQDRFGNVLQKLNTMTNRFGSYFGRMTLPKGAATGYYDITAKVAGVTDESGFEVAEYRKPEFSVDVKPLKKRYTRGEEMVFRVSAGYYFGAPVVSAPVQYTVTRNPYWFSPEYADYGGEYEYGDDGGYEDYGGYGEEVAAGEVRTNNQGIAYIRVPARWDLPKDEEDFDSDQQYCVSVSISDAAKREASADASVIATRGSFAVVPTAQTYVVAPEQKTSVNVRTLNYDRSPRKNVTVKVTAGRQMWTGSEVRFHPEIRREVKTDSQGRAIFAFSPRQAGQYKVICEATDENGNLIRSNEYLWVTNSGSSDLNYHYPELDIIPDKKVYEPGETAHVLINSERTGVTALVTVEGEKLFDYRLVELKAKSTTVDIPIRSDYKPNVFISVGCVHHKKFIQRDKPVRVSLKEQKLDVTVRPDKRRYLPGEKATYRVKVLDSDGKPVSAELSLGVVDEAIYGMRPDSTPPILGFYYRRQDNSVRTDFSSPQVYLSDADKSGFTGQVREEFQDTAFWAPSVVTDSRGTASVSFKLPDNLTTWKTTVRAATRDTAVGEATCKATCSKDLLVRLETPRFLTQRDKSEITGIIHNYTSGRKRVSVSLRSSNLKIEGSLDRRVTLDAGGSKDVHWNVSAPDPGVCEIGIYAQAGTLTDAMKLRLPIHPHGQEYVQYFTGATRAGGETVQKINLRTDAIKNATEVTVRLSPSLAGTLIGGLDYLAGYPYGCTEQTMSRFLPDVVVWQTLKQLGISNPELEKKLPDMVTAGLLKLYSYQHEDGGWGWCEYDQTDTWMTAYVVYGLLAARNAGFSVNHEILSRGVSALKRKTYSRSRVDTGPVGAFSLYALSLAEKDEALEKAVQRLYEHRRNASDQALAYLALTLHRVGRPGEAKVVMDQLMSRANESPAFVFWTGDVRNGYLGTETAGAALMAAMQVNPDDPRIPKVVMWMMKERRDNHWVSTRDTAVAIYGLSAYLKKTKELEPDLSVVVACNGRPVKDVKLDESSLFAPEQEISINPRLLRTGVNRLEIRTTGKGNLYYTIKFKQYAATEDVPQTLTSSGIRVTRRYYRLIPKWNDRMMSTSFVPASEPTNRLRVGDSVRIRLVIDSPRSYDYVLIEDLLPAGCEAADAGKKYPWEWRNWWAAQEVRDDRVCFYADRLPQGRSVIEYEVRAITAGDYHVMPCQVYAMYDPNVRAATAEMRLSLR